LAPFASACYLNLVSGVPKQTIFVFRPCLPDS
jgi:hypothetical protein